jgi:hypothetical protein
MAEKWREKNGGKKTKTILSENADSVTRKNDPNGSKIVGN